MTEKHRCESWLRPIAQYHDDERGVQVASGTFSRDGFRGLTQCDICGKSFQVEFRDAKVLRPESTTSTSLPRWTRMLAPLWRKFSTVMK